MNEIVVPIDVTNRLSIATARTKVNSIIDTIIRHQHNISIKVEPDDNIEDALRVYMKEGGRSILIRSWWVDWDVYDSFLKEISVGSSLNLETMLLEAIKSGVNYHYNLFERETATKKVFEEIVSKGNK